ncbi:MAG TPA: hypothetical protein PLC54_03010 [Spirochaetales bacterium]|nr:hypothetical protein [Spirochaetales bacterium]
MRRIFLCLFALIVSSSLTAEPLSSFLSSETMATLAAAGEARASSTGSKAALSLGVIHPAVAGLKTMLTAENPDVIVEALFSWKKPVGSSKGNLLSIYNIMRAIGSLEGIEYWSESRGKMRLFYEQSSLVSGPDGKTRIPDQAQSMLPASERLYARQKDLSFGDNIYRIDLVSGSDWLLFTSVNLTAMRYGIVPVAGPEKVSVRILMINADDAILFYAVSSARAAMIPGMRGKLEDSFGNRAAAIYAWFGKKAARAWAP